MSDSKQGGGEPSMEEILASIRKIISEDTAEGGQKNAETGASDDTADASAADAGAGASAGRSAGVGDDVLELSDDAGAETTEDDDGAPLDLTEEVETAAADADPGNDAPLELDDPVADEADGAPEADAGEMSASDDIGAYDDWPAGDGADGAPGETAGVGADADDTPFLADPFDDTAAGAEAPDTAAEAALAAGAMAGAGGAGADKGARRSADTASPLGPEDQRVVSDQTEQQAVEQLTSLARQAENAPGDSAADNVDHILARMVRDALRPQLREWMDRNLPQIVERIVREEVQRMTRRAQGLDDDTKY